MILKTAANMQEHGYIETGKEGGYYEVDGQRTEIGGGGDSRFSTCEVEVSFTLNGEPLTLDMGEIYLSTEYTASPVTGDDLGNVWYASNAITAPDKKTVKPLLFEGVAYIDGVSGRDSNNAYYDWNTDVTPVVTGDISIGSHNESPAVIVRGNGTITFDMVEGD